MRTTESFLAFSADAKLRVQRTRKKSTRFLEAYSYKTFLLLERR